MKIRKWMTAALLALALGSALAACGKTAAKVDSTGAESTETEGIEAEGAEAESAEAESAPEAEPLRVGALKGPTSMGLAELMKRSGEETSRGKYSFLMAVQPDEIAAKLASGELDIALIPANMASVLYNKTGGALSAIDINALGVLYCVTGDESVASVKDLEGKTVITTGQGATPEYALRYLLKQNGVKDCRLEFKSEATEIAAALKADPSEIAVLPQPFATVALMQNDALRTAFSLADAWDELGGDSRMVTGVTVARREVIEEREEELCVFLEEHGESVLFAEENPAAAAELVVSYGIIEKAPVAERALPLCNLACITGEEMKAALSGYLETLFSQDEKSVGGKLPEEDFYYIP